MFADLELRPLILENLKKCGYTKPTPIQRYAAPILASHRDIMACAQTGSGKSVRTRGLIRCGSCNVLNVKASLTYLLNFSVLFCCQF